MENSVFDISKITSYGAPTPISRIRPSDVACFTRTLITHFEAQESLRIKLEEFIPTKPDSIIAGDTLFNPCQIPREELEKHNSLGERILHLAAKTSEENNTLIMLLACGAFVDSLDCSGCTPLIHAARAGNSVGVKHLISYQANPHVRNKRGETALEIALAKNYQEIATSIDQHASKYPKDGY